VVILRVPSTADVTAIPTSTPPYVFIPVEAKVTGNDSAVGTVATPARAPAAANAAAHTAQRSLTSEVA
jgi:hypothetical protein